MDGVIFQAKTPEARQPRWWSGQIGDKVSRPQMVYDIVAGVIAPLLCFYFDPMIFKSSSFELGGPALFPEYQVMVYTFSALQMVVLCLWYLSGGAFRSWNPLIAGVLICGGVFCGIVGVVLFPFSIFGMMLYGIGIFGFTPFFTGVVYLRNGIRAWRAGSTAPAGFRPALLWLGILLVLTVPPIMSTQLHQFVDNSLDAIIRGDSRSAIAVAQQLKPINYIASSEMDRLVRAYISEPDATRRELIKTCYREITGADIDERARIMMD